MVPRMIPLRVCSSVSVRVADKAGTILEFGQSEIRQFGVTARGDQDVIGLDIAVQNTGLMGGGQTIGDAGQQLGDILPIARLPLNPVLERAAVDEFGHQILPAVEFTYVIDGEDVRMIERRRHLRLALKSPASCRIGEVVGEELDRHGPVELGIDSPKDNVPMPPAPIAVSIVYWPR